MYGWLRYLAFTALWFIALVSCTPTNKSVRYPLSVNQDGQVVQDVYVDSTFSFDEYQSLRAGANEWAFTTRGIAKFNFIYPYFVEDRTFNKIVGKNIIIKTTSKDSYVIRTDKEIETENKKKGITQPFVALGFWHKVSEKDVFWYIGMVVDRMETLYKLKVVAIHEFGHSLHMQHGDKQDGIMNSSASMNTGGCLTRYDMQQFAQLYGHEVDAMNYCHQK